MSKNFDFWIKSSFDSSLPQTSDQRVSKLVNKKSNKRQLTSDSTETVAKNVDKFKSDSICLLDSMAAQNSTDLAFSRQKLNQLSDWFRHQFVDNRSDSKLLLLNGPTGSGKTTSLKVLAKEFNVEVIEHKSYNQEFEINFDDNMTERRENSLISLNQIENFKQFICDSIHFKRRLDFESNDGAICLTSGPTTDRYSHRLILIEEFPNVFHYKPDVLHKELRLLNRRFGKRLIPIVFIISETSNGQSEEYKLLPKTLQLELGIKTISFKPISDASLSKILQRLSDNNLTQNQIEELIDGASGDVRCAINNMQLLCMHSIDDKCDKSVKKLRKTKQKTESKSDYLLRDPSLTITHAIGKVLYSKRIDSADQPSNGENISEVTVNYKLPPHLKDMERNPHKDNPEAIADKISVSSDVFNAWLHQNYIEFCDSIECAQNCIDWLCLSDSLFTGEHHFNDKSNFESYKSLVAISGLMFNLSNDSNDSNRQSIDTKQSSKPKRNFKGFEKPQIFGVNRLAESLSHQISQSLSQNNWFHSVNNLVIDLIPFVSQMPKHLQNIDNKLKHILETVVTYKHRSKQINEQELCYALNQSSVANRSEKTRDQLIFQSNRNEDQNRTNVLQINSKPIDEEEYRIEEFDSD